MCAHEHINTFVWPGCLIYTPQFYVRKMLTSILKLLQYSFFKNEINQCSASSRTLCVRRWRHKESDSDRWQANNLFTYLLPKWSDNFCSYSVYQWKQSSSCDMACRDVRNAIEHGCLRKQQRHTSLLSFNKRSKRFFTFNPFRPQCFLQLHQPSWFKWMPISSG